MKPATFFLRLAICFTFFQATTPGIVAQEYVPDSSFWEPRASMHQARSYFPVVHLGRKIYAFGGILTDNGVVFTYTDSIEEYNIGEDTWVVKGVLPQPMGAMAAVELKGAIYIIGGVTEPAGVTSSKKVYRYFSASGTFDADTIASLPAARSFLSACVVGDKIYAIGGASGFVGAVSNTVYVYDPSINKWNVGPALHVGRAVHTCAVVGSKIYVMGGTINWADGINSVEVLNTATPNATWDISDKPLLHARGGHGSAVLSDIIYTLGGIHSVSSAEMSVEAFGPEIAGGDNWEVFENLSYDRRAFGCVALPPDILWPSPFSYIYVIGGNSGNTAIPNTQRLGIMTVGVDEALPNALENANAALSNFPNPFAQNTIISYQMDKSANITIDIFDARGQLIAVPVSGLQTPGEHHVPFDATRLEAGVYFCVLNRNDGAGFVRKMVVMR